MNQTCFVLWADNFRHYWCHCKCLKQKADNLDMFHKIVNVVLWGTNLDIIGINVYVSNCGQIH